MAVAYQSFTLQQGQNVELAIAVVDNDGAVVDLTGASARFAMARDAGATVLIDSDTATATLTITDASGGLLSVYIDDSETDAFLGDYYYEVKVTDISGNETIVTKGWITVQAALT